MRARFIGLATIGALLMTLGLVACGGSDSSTDSSATTSTTGSEEATTEGASGTMSLAEERLAGAETPQKELPLKTPLESAPEAGRTIVVMQCDNPACTINTEAVEDAAKLVGDKVKVIPFQFANPATLVAGMKTALRYDPIATLVVGLPEETWSSVVPEYEAEAEGVAIVGEGLAPAELNKAVVAVVESNQDTIDVAHPLSDWIAVDSAGKGKALFEQVPEVSSVASFQQGVEEEMKEVCPGCELATTPVTLEQIGSGQANAAVISTLRADPSIEYLVIPNGAWSTGLPNALKAAGLTDVKVLGITPENEQFVGLENGTEAAWVSFSIRVSAFAAVDAALRYSEGMKVPTYDGVVAIQLITEDNVGTLSQESKDLGVPPPYDYAAAYAKLWHAG